MRRPSGYTLVEMLVVLAIIVVLIGLAVASASTYFDRTRGRSMRAEKEMVSQAIGVYNLSDAGDSGQALIAALVGADAVRIDPAAVDAPLFAKYLKTATKYFYAWENEGGNLIVYERADKTGRSY